MKKEVFEEGKGTIIAVVATAVILQVVFFRSSIGSNLLMTVALWWMALPGVVATQHWRKKTAAMERVVIGSVAGLAASGIAMYYLGILGIAITTAAVLGPLLLLLAALATAWKRGVFSEQAKEQ